MAGPVPRGETPIPTLSIMSARERVYKRHVTPRILFDDFGAQVTRNKQLPCALASAKFEARIAEYGYSLRNLNAVRRTPLLDPFMLDGFEGR